MLRSFDDIVTNPELLWGKTSEEVSQILGDEWKYGSYGKMGTGWKFTKDDKSVFFHEGGRHVGKYYGFASGKTKKVKVVDKDYVPTIDDKARLIRLK